jgi:hypothetical protein
VPLGTVQLLLVTSCVCENAYLLLSESRKESQLVSIMRKLIEAGADVNARVQQLPPPTVLHSRSSWAD